MDHSMKTSALCAEAANTMFGCMGKEMVNSTDKMI